MSAELESDIRIWAAEVEHISRFGHYFEVTNALLTRDSIQEALDTGEILSPEYESMLHAADNKLMAQRQKLVERFPDVFSPARQEAGPPSYWWWFLNEGPDVRKRREAA